MNDQRAEIRKVFVAATKQDQGKTTVSLGLLAAFNEHHGPVGFIKPVGQRYIEVEGARVDEDVALIRTVFPSETALGDMMPVTVDKSFTRKYIKNPHPEELMDRILESFSRLCAGKRSVVIEGTGHAGVGSCFDTSNADVASALGAKVLLVTSGGIGKPIDEVMLNHSFFRDRGVEFLGVVLNKVLPDKLESIREMVRTGLARKGIELLGCIPYEPLLANPTVRHVFDEMDGELINGAEGLGNEIKTVVVGAMSAHRALEHIAPHCLLITPGERDDVILAAMSTGAIGHNHTRSVAGILLTGGIAPHKSILSLIERTDIPVILVNKDSYSAAATVNHLKVKICPADEKKIATASRLVREHVDFDRILERI